MLAAAIADVMVSSIIEAMLLLSSANGFANIFAYYAPFSWVRGRQCGLDHGWQADCLTTCAPLSVLPLLRCPSLSGHSNWPPVILLTGRAIVISIALLSSILQ